MKNEHLKLCRELRHELHQHPELSGQEVWTKARLMNFLKEHTSLTVVDKGHYFYALAKGKTEQAAIAFRADFDALPIEDEIDSSYRSQIPGVGHKCGHDGHAATLCGLALELDQMDLDRTVVLLFQPAEETGAGAKSCLDVFDEVMISEFYAYHNYPGEPFQMVSLIPGTICLTSKGLNLFFEGKPSHASRPEDGINPAYVIAKVLSKIETLGQENTLFKGFIRCTIVHVQIGEEAFGVSAGKGVIRLTIRAYHEEDLDTLEKLIVQWARDYSLQAGVTFSQSEQEYFPATVNHPDAVKKVWKACESIGQSIRTLPEFFRASEDFGYFLKKVPGAMIFIGDGEDYAPLHTLPYDFPDELIEVGVRVFLSIIQQEALDDET